MKTIAQIAAEAGVSKTAVRKHLTDAIRQNNIEVRNGVIYIDENGESQIRSKFKGCGFAETFANQPETVSEVSANVSGMVSDLVSALQKQLDEKDKQIAELLQALQREQTLHAGTQTKLLTASKPSEPEKVSWWRRLFRRGK